MTDYTRFQKKVIRRYYDNAETIGYQQLAELTSDIYLAEGPQRDRLWKRVETAMKKLKLPQPRIDHVLARRDPAILAELVRQLTGS